MKQYKVLLILLMLGGMLQAVVITSWDFEASNTTPNVGSGSLSLIGGVTHDAYSSGYNGSSKAWSTTGYPAQGTNNRTGGLYMAVSSVGYGDVSISWALRYSNTSANRTVLYYTLDRTAGTPVWVEAGTYNATAGDSWFTGSFDGSSIPEMDSNPYLGFKLVSSFANAANDAYVAANSTSTYAASGKWRFDNIVFSGTATVPSLSITSALQPFYAAPGSISPIQTYQVNGYNLTSDLLITAPQYFQLRTTGYDTFSSELDLMPRSGIVSKQIEVVFMPVVSGDFNGDIIHNGGGITPQQLAVTGSTVLPEPSQYPTGLSASGITYYQAYLNWTDAGGAIPPTGYLIKGSKVSAEDIVDPVDGVPEADKKLTKNVAYGVQTQLIYELNETHPYYFKIYPYTNTGTAIDYKTDATVPLINFTTSTGPIGSTLDPGDLAFVEYASDSPDRFSFVLLKDVLENTKVNFTDKAWTGTAFAETEEVYEWRAVGRAYTKGEVIHIEEGILHPDEGIYNPDFEGFSNNGDQIIAFQGYLTTPSFLAAFSTTNWLTSGTPTNSSSYLPSSLALGTNALGFDTEVDDGYYAGPQLAPATALLTAINNPANWVRDNSLASLSFPEWEFHVDCLAAPEVQISTSDPNTLHLTWPSVTGATSYCVFSSALPDAAFPSAWTVENPAVPATELNLTATNPRRFFRVVSQLP